ncbi:large ribosomal subunit protein bL17m-like [Glandiceps talaboti]
MSGRKYFPNHPRQRKHGKMFRNMSRGPHARLRLLQGMVTALIRHERIETSFPKAHETQKYAEKLIDVAKRGYKDAEAMKVANTWLADKDLVHKLFKVLVPRYENQSGQYTKLWHIGERGNHLHPKASPMAFLEYCGNPFPPLQPVKKKNPNWLINVLLQGVKKDVEKTDALELAKTVTLGTAYDFTGRLDQDVRVKKQSNSVDSPSKTTSSDIGNDEGTPV